MGQSVQVSNGMPSCIRSGEVLGGKYRLERELGRGAMGTVWAAQHLSLGQRVAIKLIAAEHAQSAEARERFSVEAKAAARLKSRHVVQVYDDGETHEGTPYIVMEYLEGESLEARIEREREIPLVDAVRITAQVARALARAHAQNIVHRDLKPGNIYLARSDEDEVGWTAKVLDFGVAKIEEHREHSTTKAGTVLGTPLFMSPEQVRGASSVDGRADLYSLGMCFYNMVSGKLAFDGDSFGDVLVSLCTEPLPELKHAAPWIPDSVGAWFQRCCARDPALRFQSAEELIAALQSASGPSVQSVNRSSLAAEQIGPCGTMTGHSPPRVQDAPAIGNDSGTFGVVETAETDPALANELVAGNAERGAVSDAAAVLTVSGARAPGRARRTGAWALLGVLALAAVVSTVWRIRGNAETVAPLGPESATARTRASPARAGVGEPPQPNAEPPQPNAEPPATERPAAAEAAATPLRERLAGPVAPKRKAVAGPVRPSATATSKANKRTQAAAAVTVDIGF